MVHPALGQPGTNAWGDGVDAALAANATNIAATVPRWAPTTAYTTGQQVVSPNNDVVSRVAGGTSGASYVAANWTLSPTYGRTLSQAVGEYRCSPGSAFGASYQSVLTGAPFIVVGQQSFDRITCEVTTAGAAGALIRLGIYALNATTGVVGSLVLDAGTIDGTVVAIAQVTIAVTLPSGAYLLVATPQGVVSPYPATRRLTSPIGNSGTGSPTGAAALGGWQGTSAPTGALPTTATWSTSGITGYALINLRRSA
jgi:hypothetical protein